MNDTLPTAEQLAERLRDLAEGARSKADLIASKSPTSVYTDPVDVLRAIAKEAEDGLGPDPDAGLEIQRTLYISTAHLPVTHREWLDGQNRCNSKLPRQALPTACNPNYVFHHCLIVGPIVDPISDYGWRICLAPGSTTEFIISHELDDPLAMLIRFAENRECDWLAIDRDGPIVPGLPTFEDDE